MSYITNIDTLSALLDRLISENIKLHFFRKEDVVDDIEHQENLIEEIKYRITQLLSDTYNERQYKYISEKRTYKPEDIVETLEELIHNDITTGEGDRANLKEATSDNPSLEHFTRNHKLIKRDKCCLCIAVKSCVRLLLITTYIEPIQSGTPTDRV